MPYSNGKITAPVSIYDVRRALNASANDVGRLCAHQKINMWARYKPETAVTGLVTLGISPITLQNRVLNGYGIECRSNA